MKKSAMTVLLAGTTLLASAKEMVFNGDFEDGTKGWTVIGLKDTTDEETSVTGKKSLRIDLPSPHWNRVYQKIAITPDTDYIVSYNLKLKDVHGNGKRNSGVYIALSGKDGKEVSYGTARWTFATGTAEWTKHQFQFNSKMLGNPEQLTLQLMMSMDCSGTAWFDSVSIQPVEKSATSYHMRLYPLCFQKNQGAFCENLPAVLQLMPTGKGKSPDEKAEMELILPDFLELVGVCEGGPIIRAGKITQIPCKVVSRKVQIGKRDFTCHKISFDLNFSKWLWHGGTWYKHFIVMRPSPGSAGKEGVIKMSFQLGMEKQPETSFRIRILPSAEVKNSCRMFQLALCRSITGYLPFPEAAEAASSFWNKLTSERFMLSGSKNEYNMLCPNYTVMVSVFGNDFATAFNSADLKNLQKKLPQDITESGKPHRRAFLSTHAKVDDPDKFYETYLRKTLRDLARVYPGFKILWWDFEPGPHGYDEAGRKRFARQQNLNNIPSIEDIRNKYPEQWFQYMVRLHAEFIAKTSRIIREELPEVKIYLVSDPLQMTNPHVALWCGVDVSLSDKDIDLHMHMPYYSGSKYFDDVAYNIRTLKKPFFPLVDPAERQESFFRRYAPEKIEQNIVATAALGGKGFGFWPDDMLDGTYYPAIASGFEKVALGEHFYFKGKRCDEDFQILPRNVNSRKLPNGKHVNFPDFSKDIRFTAHRLFDETLLTIFNYNESQSILAEISGKNIKNFLVEIPAVGCIAVNTKTPPPQKELRKMLTDFKSDNPLFSDVSKGEKRLFWDADGSGRTLLVMQNEWITAGIDPFETCEIISLKTNRGNELFQEGFAGRIMLHDPLQKKLRFKVNKCGIKKSRPFVIASADIESYEGANPVQNPLYGMKIEKHLELDERKVIISVKLSNPTDHEMPLAFRLNNFPYPGRHLKTKGIALQSGASQFPSHSANDILLLRQNKKISFMPQLSSQIWNGDTVYLKANADHSTESIAFIPLSEYAGIYSWTQKGTLRKTVELLPGEQILKPGQTISYRYAILPEVK